MEVDKYMMATEAFHKMGNISRDTEDICHVDKDHDDHYHGRWVTGFGLIDVIFPKETTRELTPEEIKKYNKMNYQISDQPSYKLNI